MLTTLVPSITPCSADGEDVTSRTVVPNLGSPDVLGLELPEAFTISYAGQDFWEL